MESDLGSWLYDSDRWWIASGSAAFISTKTGQAVSLDQGNLETEFE